MNTQHSTNNGVKTKPVSRGFQRSLKTWMAQAAARGDSAAVSAYRDAIRQKKMGLSLEFTNLVNLDRRLRQNGPRTEWWAQRGR